MNAAPGAPEGSPELLEGFSQNGVYYTVSMGYQIWLGGEPGSALPIHNAYNIFKKLKEESIVPEGTRLAPDPEQSEVSTQGPFGDVLKGFQVLRRLTNEGADRLSRLQDHVKARRTVFISYRRVDAGDLVREVTELLSDDALCWWDAQALPQAREFEQESLPRMLIDGIRQADWFVPLLTDNYARAPKCQEDGAWTLREWEEFRAMQSDESISSKPKTLPVLVTERPLAEAVRDLATNPMTIVEGMDPVRISARIRERIQSRS